MSCLRMSLSQFEETVRHRRGADGSPAEAWEHGGEVVAAVEAVLELGQIARDVLVADRAIGADDRRLDVAQRGIDPLEGGCQHRFAAGAGADRLMRAAGRGDAAEARQSIANDGAGGIQAALGQGFDLRAPEAPHPAQFEAHRPALAVVSTVATIGVLPAAPRPRLPPERWPPR